MEQDITVKIPRGWIKGLPEEELTLKQLSQFGIILRVPYFANRPVVTFYEIVTIKGGQSCLIF
jgi:hypothetical protein